MFGCRHLPVQLPRELMLQLAAAYAEPHRAYHNCAHIAEVLGWFDRVGDDLGWLEPAEVYLAILFHDAIYEPGAKDNEARSADWARSAELGTAGEHVQRDRVAELIELTARHGTVTAADHDAALFLDSDMAILGAPADAFAAYDQQIALEYQALPAEAYQAGRRAFLAGLAAKPRVFLTDYFHTRLDAQARANLAAALSSPR